MGLPAFNGGMAAGIVEPRTSVLRSTHGQDTQGRPLAASAFTSGRGPCWDARTTNLLGDILRSTVQVCDSKAGSNRDDLRSV